jgi:hypothetical protein
MRQEGLLRTYARQFVQSKLLAGDEWESPDTATDSRLERQIVPWLLLAALLIGCANMIYAFIELIKAGG